METPTPTPKQQIVERLRSAQSVLVTVSNSPSLDEIISALALSKILDRVGKKATTVISSPLPSKLDALKIDKMVSKSIDRLRDFVIELDKSKADKLRYKAEDDVVKIFITPYKSEIKASDLHFTQGEYNVDAVVAIGVASRDDLDNVVKEHNRVLHNADVLDLSVGEKKGGVGTLSWHEPEASSVSEMLVSLADSLQSGLLDAEIAQLLLSAIVVATEGFRNKSTTPKIMTLAAQLMASGASSQQSMSQFVDSSKPAPNTDKAANESLSIDHNENEPKSEPEHPAKKEHHKEKTAKKDKESSSLSIDPNLGFPPSGRSGTTREQDKRASDAIDSMIAGAREMNEQMKSEREQITHPATNTPILEHKNFSPTQTSIPEVLGGEPHVHTNPEPPVLRASTPSEPHPLTEPAQAPASNQHEHNVEVAREAVTEAVQSDPIENVELVKPIVQTANPVSNLTIDHNGQVRTGQ